jgi:hypothetical protein
LQVFTIEINDPTDLIFAQRKSDADIESLKKGDPAPADSAPVVPTFRKKIDVNSGKNPINSKITKI